VVEGWRGGANGLSFTMLSLNSAFSTVCFLSLDAREQSDLIMRGSEPKVVTCWDPPHDTPRMPWWWVKAK
jgi:hypothetical protein